MFIEKNQLNLDKNHELCWHFTLPYFRLLPSFIVVFKTNSLAITELVKNSSLVATGEAKMVLELLQKAPVTENCHYLTCLTAP